MPEVAAPQVAFGDFDPKFLGVGVRIGSEVAWRLMDDHIRMGRTPPVGALLDAAPHKAFETLSLLTVMSHEMRHFHDFLIGPFGSEIFRTRVSASVNALQVLYGMRDPGLRREVTCVPVPLSRWCRMPVAQREAFLAGPRWFARAQGRPPLVAPDLPVMKRPPDLATLKTTMLPQSRDVLATQIAVTVAYYEKLARLVRNTQRSPGGQEFQPYHVGEASALLVQTEEVMRAFGVRSGQFFLQRLLTERTMPYWVVLTTLADMFARTGDLLDARRASAVVQWALLGSYVNDGDRGRPEVRLAHLWQLLKRRRGGMADASVAELFRDWDRSLRYSPTLESLPESLRVDRALATQLRGVHDRLEAADPLRERIGELRAVFDMFVVAREHCVAKFVADPDAYVDPARYYAGAFADYSNPPIMLIVDGPAALVAEDPAHPFEERGYLAYRAMRGADGRELVTMLSAPATLTTHDHFDRVACMDVFTMFTVVDVLFSEFRHRLGDFELKLAEQALAGTGVRLLMLDAPT